MHRNSNITGNPISTFHNAGIFDFGHLQHIDFQCLFSYKNALTFTGKEKDSETGFYYFGARYYDPSLSGLFLSVDPLADKYPSISPYAYCAWNPVKLVDPDGQENIIYVVNLQGRNGAVNVNNIIEESNNRFRELGLETRVMMAPDGVDFNPKYMDKTDSYVLIGETGSIKEFVKNNSPNQYKNFSNWLGGTDNPEKSVNNRTRKGDIICIDANALESAAARLNTDSKTMGAFLIMHGAGHNAGMNHSNELPRDEGQSDLTAAIMMSGNAKSWFSNRSANIAMNKDMNSFYIEKMRTMFGNKKATSNYDYNKIKTEHPYIVY